MESARSIDDDRVYRGPKLLNAISELGKWTIEVVTRSQSVGTFKAEPKRWVIERTFAWFGRNRRLAKELLAIVADDGEARLPIDARASVIVLAERPHPSGGLASCPSAGGAGDDRRLGDQGFGGDA